ncbi:uncharacterized protein LOC127104300 [Lathyrus oleraceus]|uniref:uncharacterized protein LOC127104300 n=1 Tax=Pisum sativum TaxID=3888 RepID=UPI0021D2B102|nr:uncharacterized protein LOC127104300 [Pisum sativum]
MNACDIVLLENDKGTKRMQKIIVMTGECHLYVTHPVSQPGIIGVPILSLGLDDEVVLDVGDEFEVNETDVGTTVVQDSAYVRVGFKVDETDMETTVVQQSTNVGTHVGDDGINCDIEDNVGDDGTNCDIEENMGDEGIKCDIEENMDEEGTKFDIEKNMGEEGTKCDIEENGFLPDIEELLGNVDHEFCVKHLYSNLRKKFHGLKLKELIRRDTTANHVNAWEKIMLEIKGVNEEAFKHLDKIPPRFWSKSRFRTSISYDTSVNNMSETSNSVFVAARAKPIVTMLEEIRVARNSEKGTKNVIARKSSQPTTASSFFFTVFYTLFYAALDIKVDSFVVVLTFLCWVSSSFIVNSISFELAWKFADGESSTCLTVYKNGGAPAVFQSPKCPRWRLFDYDSSPRTATRCQSSMLQGRRKSQEDRTLCVLDVRIPFPGTMGIREVVVGIVAVFDGHNGAEASEMASKLLMEYFVLHTYFLLDAMYSVVSKTSTGKLLHRRDHDHGNLLHRWKEILGWQWHELHSERLQNVFSANFDDSFHLEILKEALLRAIHDIDVRFSEEASRNNIHSGSTATVVLVADDKFLVANIGDSKAFLCSENFQSPKEAKASLLELYRQTERDGSVSVWDREKYRLASSHGLNHFAVKELTRDHHPDREDERTRVEAAGGQVLNWGGLPRVNGQLAITRAIGDVLFKR